MQKDELLQEIINENIILITELKIELGHKTYKAIDILNKIEKNNDRAKNINKYLR